MQKHSQQDKDGVIWQTVPLRLGMRGLDLRRPDDPGVLSELLNARFLDDRTVKRRDGHVGRAIQSPIAGEWGGFYEEHSFRPTDEWVYGHGARINVLNDDRYEDAYHPIHIRGGGTFQFEGTDVVWTGDRVFLVSDDGAFFGGKANDFFARDFGGVGEEALLPVQTDSIHDTGVSGDFFDFALTDRFKVVVANDSDNLLRAWVYDRQSGALLKQTDLVTIEITRLRVLNSNGTPFVFWLDDTGALKRSFFDGSAWAAASTVQAGVDDFDACETPSGMHLVWREGADVMIGNYVRHQATSTPFVFPTAVTTDGSTPDGGVTVAVSPGGDIAVLWNGQDGGGHDSVYVRQFSSSMVDGPGDAVTGDALELTSADQHGAWTITAAFEGLRDDFGRYKLFVYGQQPGVSNPCVHTWAVRPTLSGSTPAILCTSPQIWYNATLASKAFRVGQLVFAWLCSDNSATNFLLAASEGARGKICGIADREEAIVAPDGWLPGVQIDPDNEHVRHWIRKRDLGDYIHVGNLRVGTINFLPKLSTANYGKSVYLAGSLVRNYDGHGLGDAGFHDYPLVLSHTPDTSGGTLTVADGGVYQCRVYPVRYNKCGERFQGPAITYAVTLAGAQVKFILNIATMPCTNHDDVVYEVYITDEGGSTFYYAGKVEHSQTAETVSFEFTTPIAVNPRPTGDPFAAGVGALSELEEFGPTGCAVLVTAADRLWGIGGQVPAGVAQYSKLFSLNEGASFDALGGTQILDAEGKPLTSIGCVNDATIVGWQEDQFYVLTGDGPDNYGQGSFSTPQVVIADGALYHAGTLALPVGIAYWGHGGPRLMTMGFEVENISEPVKPLADTMVPSGVRVDHARREVVWYTEEGDALLWNYAAGNYASNRPAQSAGSRWARWTGLKIAGCSQSALVTVDGRYLVSVEDHQYDDGGAFTFTLRTGNVRLEDLLQGGVLLARAGMTGKYLDAHDARFRIYYDGSPLWSESLEWDPEEGTWLVTGEDYEDMTPAEIDALTDVDKSGRYATHFRVKRQTCQFFQFEVSDRGDAGFIPWEFVFLVGASGPLGRTPVNTMTRS